MKALSELGISPWPWQMSKIGKTSVMDRDYHFLIHYSPFTMDYRPGGEMICDSTLIAAAPEMAKVCYDLIMWDGNLDAKFLKIIDDAKTAYAKASGEEAK